MEEGSAMTCVKCKKEIPDGSAWCCWCGKKQITERQRRPKRANGTGSVIKRGQTWTCVITVGIKPDGTAVRKTKGGFPTRKAALDHIETLKYKPTAQRTLRQLYDAIQPRIEKLSKDKRSHYRTAWSRLERLHGESVADLSVADLQAAMDQAVGSFYPAKDIRDLLSLIFDRAMTEELVSINKARHLVLPDLEEKSTEPFTAEEVKALWCDYQDGHVETGFFLVMIYTGMMPGELRRLTVDRIDFRQRRITGVGLKTEKRKETPVVIPEIIVPVLQALTDGLEPSERIVRIDEPTFYAVFAEMKARCGCRPIKELRPYSCRHTLATTLADQNVSAEIIKEIMRHAKITTTQRYMHPDRDLYAKRLNAALHQSDAPAS